MHHQFCDVVVNGGRRGKHVVIAGELDISVPPWGQRIVRVGIGQTLFVQSISDETGNVRSERHTLVAFSPSGTSMYEWMRA